MYIVEWIIPNRIVLFRGVGDQSIDTVEDAVNRLMQCLSDGQAPVHVISDTRYTGKFPLDLKLMGKFMQKHENSGFTVSIGGNQVTKFFTKMLNKFTGDNKLTFKETFDDAFTFLRAVDQSLPTDIDFADDPPEQQASD